MLDKGRTLILLTNVVFYIIVWNFGSDLVEYGQVESYSLKNTFQFGYCHDVTPQHKKQYSSAETEECMREYAIWRLSYYMTIVLLCATIIYIIQDCFKRLGWWGKFFMNMVIISVSSGLALAPPLSLSKVYPYLALIGCTGWLCFQHLVILEFIITYHPIFLRFLHDSLKTLCMRWCYIQPYPTHVCLLTCIGDTCNTHQVIQLVILCILFISLFASVYTQCTISLTLLHPSTPSTSTISIPLISYLHLLSLFLLLLCYYLSRPLRHPILVPILYPLYLLLLLTFLTVSWNLSTLFWFYWWMIGIGGYGLLTTCMLSTHITDPPHILSRLLHLLAQPLSSTIPMSNSGNNFGMMPSIGNSGTMNTNTAGNNHNNNSNSNSNETLNSPHTYPNTFHTNCSYSNSNSHHISNSTSVMNSNSNNNNNGNNNIGGNNTSNDWWFCNGNGNGNSLPLCNAMKLCCIQWIACLHTPIQTVLRTATSGEIRLNKKHEEEFFDELLLHTQQQQELESLLPPNDPMTTNPFNNNILSTTTTSSSSSSTLNPLHKYATLSSFSPLSHGTLIQEGGGNSHIDPYSSSYHNTGNSNNHSNSGNNNLHVDITTSTLPSPLSYTMFLTIVCCWNQYVPFLLSYWGRNNTPNVEQLSSSEGIENMMNENDYGWIQFVAMISWCLGWIFYVAYLYKYYHVRKMNELFRSLLYSNTVKV